MRNNGDSVQTFEVKIQAFIPSNLPKRSLQIGLGGFGAVAALSRARQYVHLCISVTTVRCLARVDKQIHCHSGVVCKS